MSQFIEGQIHQLADALQEHGYTPADLTALGQNSNGVLAQVKLVLMGLATIVRVSLKLVLDKALNPSEFIGQGWAFWKGPADGNGLEGEESCVQEPDVVDFERIILETHLKEGESSIHGEEKMKRAGASKNQQLGAKAFLALWNDYQVKKAEGKPGDSVLERLRKSGKIGTRIYFFGFILRHPGGSRRVLCLFFHGGEWRWDCLWLGFGWGAGSPSASLASVIN
ncbi:MAG: hypothetical protein A2365_02225 [Candidatus Nealsonbacteria bacterium RIFOXYB1_FULL_40_15]|uniref:Uncharacterized protein n=2 Tax=Candidatus Nealsoniibacteriota TaxID=1817911 RepID=A0A1G2ETL4_9BACT|nr:MAG: hypothetical protein A2365_02225 [Candidatus Nealsonbacteria bacterium RIFOXYB1_FULL_40_15]OGZ28472.1 MAG: hypothetical protein A2562_03310 [Candidatus Nealsonbacteria bacterium RIFOXYD1_FULL_39_11]OGZ29083.1 MAG: hypothetical protein A2427_02075 [Candidatus Nealsonbacteria bacterium RIFOXYC1_FULL_40_7]